MNQTSLEAYISVYMEKVVNRNGRPLDLSEWLGREIGSWTVEAYLGYRPRHKGARARCSWFRVRCKCGRVADRPLTVLRSGRSSKCKGCAAFLNRITHGVTADPSRRYMYDIKLDRYGTVTNKTYAFWARVRNNARRTGMPVEPRWGGPDGYAHFLEDMGYVPKHGRAWLVRKDKTRGFFRDNLEFVFKKAECTYLIDGVPYTAGEIEFVHGIDRNTFVHRIEAGMSVADALSCPVASGGRKQAKPPLEGPEPHHEAFRGLAGPDAD
jgi:hypothetical protein